MQTQGKHLWGHLTTGDHRTEASIRSHGWLYMGDSSVASFPGEQYYLLGFTKHHPNLQNQGSAKLVIGGHHDCPMLQQPNSSWVTFVFTAPFSLIFFFSHPGLNHLQLLKIWKPSHVAWSPPTTIKCGPCLGRMLPLSCSQNSPLNLSLSMLTFFASIGTLLWC